MTNNNDNGRDEMSSTQEIEGQEVIGQTAAELMECLSELDTDGESGRITSAVIVARLEDEQGDDLVMPLWSSETKRRDVIASGPQAARLLARGIEQVTVAIYNSLDEDPDED